MAYNVDTAAAINVLLQQGITLEAAFDQLGVPQGQRASYQLGNGAFVVPSDSELKAAPTPQLDPYEIDGANTDTFAGMTPEQIDEAIQQRATLLRAQQQTTLQQNYNQQTASGDWRVRIQLAQGADYLYLDPDALNGGDSVLAPLVQSQGVIFPYVPTIQTNYQAAYETRDLIHSNYRGYFYRNSRVGDITVTGTFTAQDTQEAQYLLAVIHFFRSATKMFYGQDTKYRGCPPPLVFLSGFGQFQFNNHPCLISNFAYSLPNTVDYIRINPSNQGQNLIVARPLVSDSPTSTIQSAWNRINSLVNLVTQGKVSQGGQAVQDLSVVNQTVNATTLATYVPTKIEITITLLPVQTRSQVSQQFSLKEFANGSQLKGGFW